MSVLDFDSLMNVREGALVCSSQPSRLCKSCKNRLKGRGPADFACGGTRYVPSGATSEQSTICKM